MTELCLLRVVVARGAQHHHHAVAIDLVDKAHRRGLAGATMVEVVEGYGASHLTHRASRWALSDAVAYEILVVDEEERVRAFLAEIGPELGRHGLATTETVTLVAGRWRGTGS